jgi:hypothetical protein
MARRKSVAPEDSLNVIGPKLRDLREQAGLKSGDVIVQLQKNGWDIDPSIYSAIENRRRSLTDIEIIRILRVLNCTWHDLADD